MWLLKPWFRMAHKYKYYFSLFVYWRKYNYYYIYLLIFFSFDIIKAKFDVHIWNLYNMALLMQDVLRFGSREVRSGSIMVFNYDDKSMLFIYVKFSFDKRDRYLAHKTNGISEIIFIIYTMWRTAIINHMFLDTDLTVNSDNYKSS